MTAPTLRIVHGYFPEVDRTPVDATAHGFGERIAFVFDTDRPDRADAFFDWALYARLADEVKSVLACDRIDALDETGSIRSFWAVGELGRYGVGELADEPLRALTCYRGPEVVAFADAVPWARVGGPEPYHDSYTIAFFAKDEETIGRIERAARKAAAAQGIDDVPVIRLPPRPSAATVLDKARRLLGF